MTDRVECYVDTYEGQDWWQTTRSEAEVFGINPDLAERLMDAHFAYEILIGIADADLPERSAIHLARWKATYLPIVEKNEDGIVIFDDIKCRKFMMAEFNLPEDQCYAWIRKNEAWQFRNGLIQFK